MKKSNFYFLFFKITTGILMLSSFVVVKYPLLYLLSTLIGIIGFQQLITYKKLWVIENKVSENEAEIMIRTQKITVRAIQAVLIISAIILAIQTFHKIKF
jgi:hypothetical protein